MSAASGVPGALVGGGGNGGNGGMADALIAAAPRRAPPPPARTAKPAPFYPRIVREFDDGPDEEPMLYVRR